MRIPLLPKICMVINRIIFGAYIPPSCQLGSGTRFGYGGSGVVVHARAVVGRNCLIGPGVTIGGRSKEYNVPRLGDNVYVAGGAKVLGPIVLGDNVVIGANAVVISDIPSECIAVGVPAKVIREGIDPKDYV